MSTPKAVWDAFTTRAFVEICRDETIAGNRPSGWLSTVGYSNLEARFFERTGKRFTRKQFKNRWDFMKKEYVLWVQLINSATGLGMCPVRKTVDASDEWWSTQIVLNKKYAKFRDGPPANLECLQIMFNKAFVTGETATVPGMALGGEPSAIDLEGSASSSDEEGNEGRKGQGSGSGSGSKRKKGGKGKGKQKKNRFFEEYKKAARALSSQGTASVNHPPAGTTPTIKEFMDLIHECGVTDGTPLFFTACKLAMKPEVRELFVAIRTNEGRLYYIQSEHDSRL